MSFDIVRWKQAVLTSAKGLSSEADLLETSGLTGYQTSIQDAFKALLDEIEREVGELTRRVPLPS